MDTFASTVGAVDPGAVEALFDALSDVAFFIKDRDGRYLNINHTMVRRCGLRSKADLLGKLALDVFPRPLAETYMAQDRRVIEGGVPVQNHLELHLYPGRARGWCLTNKTPLRDGAGHVIGLMGTSQDLGLPDALHPEYGKIAAIVLHIQEHYRENVSIQALADQAGLSLSRVERLFQRVFHHSPRQLLLQSRLAAAMALIEARPQARIADIAYECGYTDHSAFSRQFKAHTAMTPAQYRLRCSPA
ncbi:MAG: AraC family transcriptional regulator [Pseudomonadota bacterium]